MSELDETPVRVLLDEALNAYLAGSSQIPGEVLYDTLGIDPNMTVGDFRERLGVDRAESVDTELLRSTDHADVWADEFAKVCPDVDRGLMIAWFANCAETAKDLQRGRIT